MAISSLKLMDRAQLQLQDQPAPVCQSFPVPLVKQCHPVWCWAAVAVSLLEAFDMNQPDGECGVVTKVIRNCSAPCTDVDTCVQTSDMAKVFTALSLNNLPLLELDPPVIAGALEAGEPIVASISEGRNTHLLILHGYCEDSGHLIIMDPRPGEDTHEWALESFNWVRSFLVPKPQPGPFVAPKQLPKRRPPRPVRERPEPPNATTLIEQQLPTILTRTYPPDSVAKMKAKGLHASTGLPIHVWSSREVLAGRLEGLTFLGWRHLVYAGDEPLLTIDLMMSGGRLVFKKATWGPAVPGLHAAVLELSHQAHATDIGLLVVPCLATKALSFKNAENQDQFLVAFSPYAEFGGQQLAKAIFTPLARERAQAERVTNQV